MHIVIVGMTGVRKSTLVNVLQGKEFAEVNNNVRPCTTRAMQYEVVEGGTKYCILDTRGLGEPSESEAPPSRALKFFKKSYLMPIVSLCGNNPRFNLVLLCVDAKRIGIDVYWKIFNLIYSDFCERKLKVGVVVTRMRERDFRGSEWKRTCRNAAKGIVEEFPEEGLIKAVPEFDKLDEPKLKECRSRILTLIPNACSTR